MSSSTVISRLQGHITNMRGARTVAPRSDDSDQAGEHLVSPGMPAYFTTAAYPGTTIHQGDLSMMVVEDVPKDMVRVANPTARDRQLVPGVTEGSRHVLSSLRDVELYRPKDWGVDNDSLQGPCFKALKDVLVEHPTHGVVHVAEGHTILCGYQPNHDYELQRERRNAD